MTSWRRRSCSISPGRRRRPPRSTRSTTGWRPRRSVPAAVGRDVARLAAAVQGDAAGALDGGRPVPGAARAPRRARRAGRGRGGVARRAADRARAAQPRARGARRGGGGRRRAQPQGAGALAGGDRRGPAARPRRAARRRPAPLPALDLRARADAARRARRRAACARSRGSSASCATRSRRPGVVAWFDWPRPELGGATPRELLADPVRLPELMLAAGSTRSTAFA